jgi:hypothetical protein
MKLIAKIFSFVICSLGFFANGQSYHNFPDSNAIWNIVGDNVFTNAEYEFRYGLYGDTVINSKSYSKVYSLFDTTLINPNSTYFGAIREDVNRKVYFLKPGYEETILYDFSAQIGDTIWYQIGGALCGDTFAFWPQTPHYLVVSTIDSILLENNEYRKKWNLNGEFMADHWVEGIGSISWFGLFNPIISDIALCGDSYSFACFRQNYETIYIDNVNCGTCYCNIILSYEDIFDNRDNKLSIFPNPAENEMVIIFLNADGPYNIQIFNMTGQNVYTRTEVHEDYLKIPVSTLQSGQYILIVSNRNKEIVREGKLIVK